MSIEKRVLSECKNTKDIASIIKNNNLPGCKGTDIICYDHVTGKPLFRGHNKVILPGSAFTASKLFGVAAPVTFPNYNTKLSLENSAAITAVPENTEIVTLFAVGVDGAGVESSQILDVDYTKWCDPADLVPFRYPSVVSDLTAAERETYFGRKTIGNNIAYYFKAFESTPIIYQQYTDGTSIDSNVYSSSNSLDAETVVELNLKVTKNDCREYFSAISSVANAKINTIELLTAWYTTVNGYKYFQNIQPLTKLNITTESLADETKGLDIIYHLYF